MVLTIRAGYDEQKQPYTKVWYTDAEDNILFLQRKGNTLQLLKTKQREQLYQDAFEAWLIDGERGDILLEQGTFLNGLYVGTYSAKQHRGTQESDLFALWSNREGMEYTLYTGEFDNMGCTLVEQLSGKNKLDTGFESFVIYAYDEKKEKAGR